MQVRNYWKRSVAIIANIAAFLFIIEKGMDNFRHATMVNKNLIICVSTIMPLVHHLRRNLSFPVKKKKLKLAA